MGWVRGLGGQQGGYGLVGRPLLRGDSLAAGEHVERLDHTMCLASFHPPHYSHQGGFHPSQKEGGFHNHKSEGRRLKAKHIVGTTL